MEKKICPIRGMGKKDCISNCAWLTPFGCAVKVMADEIMLANHPRPEKGEKKESK